MSCSRKTRFLASAVAVGFVLVLAAGCGGGDDKSTNPANQAPVVTQVLVTPNQVSPGGTASVTVSATDPDNDALTFTYQPSGGTCTGNGPVATWIAPQAAATYTVIVTVKDSKNATATGMGSLTVVSNPTQTGITGTGSLQIGQAGNVGNARVAYYANLNDWANDLAIAFVALQGEGPTGTFTLNEVPPGTYYLDIWKDMDNNGVIDGGDFFGWYGNGVYPNGSLTPFAVVQGQMKNLGTITIYAL